MDATQFNTIMQLMAQLAGQNDRLHQEMMAGFAKAHKEVTAGLANLHEEMMAGFDAVRINLAKGLANQEAISQEVLRVVGDPFEVLENEVHQIKRGHGRRLTKLERKTGLA